MGRSKLKMEFIHNVKTRQITFKKMKESLIKKAYELHTLCDVDVSIITFPPNTDDQLQPQPPQIWPPGSDKFISQFEQFKKQSPEEKMKRTVEVDDYLEERCRKLEDDIIKQRKKNYDLVYPSWNPYYNDLPEEKLIQIASVLDYKLHQSTNVKLGKYGSQPDYQHQTSEFMPNQPYMCASNLHHNSTVDNQYLFDQQSANLFDNLTYDYDASTLLPNLMNTDGDDDDDGFGTIDVNNNIIHMQNGYEFEQNGYYSGMMQNNTMQYQQCPIDTTTSTGSTMQYQCPMETTTGSMMQYQYPTIPLPSIFNTGYSGSCSEAQLQYPPPPLLLPQNQYYCG